MLIIPAVSLDAVEIENQMKCCTGYISGVCFTLQQDVLSLNKSLKNSVLESAALFIGLYTFIFNFTLKFS